MPRSATFTWANYFANTNTDVSSFYPRVYGPTDSRWCQPSIDAQDFEALCEALAEKGRRYTLDEIRERHGVGGEPDDA